MAPGTASLSASTLVIPISTSPQEGEHGQVRGVQDNTGEFRFRLKASNGQIIATGESYKTKAGVLNGIASIKRHAATPTSSISHPD